MTARKIVFVTGTRADFGKLEPLATAAAESGILVTFFVTGMHMLARYGLTKVEVHRRKIFQVVEYTNQKDGDPQDLILAKTVMGFSDFLHEEKPDLVVVHGDRVEALAAALVCATSRVNCAHVEGGEVSGTIDEIFRHCNTKLAHFHLVSSDDARSRVLRLGEHPSSIHVIGSPELDIHARESSIDIADVRSRYDIPSSDFGICVFHPVTSEISSIKEQAESIFSALSSSGKHFVVIRPNNDPGEPLITEVLEKLDSSRFRIIPSMRFAYFSTLLKHSAIVVGNSSLGVREAPFLGIPSIDLGTRQTNRARSNSISHCSPFSRDQIVQLIETNWGRRFTPDTAFGSGGAISAFERLLAQGTFWVQASQKHFSD